MSDSSEGNRSAPSYPTSFGRGWIPVERDIGLPSEDPAIVDHAMRDAVPHTVETSPTPNHNTWTPARKAAFLHRLAESGDVRASAARVGLSHQSGYCARRGIGCSRPGEMRRWCWRGRWRRRRSPPASSTGRPRRCGSRGRASAQGSATSTPTARTGAAPRRWRFPSTPPAAASAVAPCRRRARLRPRSP